MSISPTGDNTDQAYRATTKDRYTAQRNERRADSIVAVVVPKLWQVGVWWSLWHHKPGISVCVIPVSATGGRQKFCPAGEQR